MWVSWLLPTQIVKDKAEPFRVRLFVHTLTAEQWKGGLVCSRVVKQVPGGAGDSVDFLREPLLGPGSALALDRRALRPLAFWRGTPTDRPGSWVSPPPRIVRGNRRGHVLLKGGDPAAPSGTATLLRLRPSHQTRPRHLPPLRVSSATSIVLGFHDVTGGVYKARERIHRSMLTCGY